MHLTLLTYGSRGDVEPFVALGAGFRRGGHFVRLAAPETFANLAVAQDLEFVGLPGEPAALVQGLVEKAGRNPVRMVTEMSKHVVPLAVRVSERVRAACEGADVVVHSFLMTQAGYEAAKELEVPDVSAQLLPVFSSTCEFPSPVFPELPLGDVYRQASHGLTTQAFRRGGQLLYWWVRRRNPDLPVFTGWPFDRHNQRRSLALYAFSPSVVPQPADWPVESHITGYWFLEDMAGWRPPEFLRRFLADGAKPVCIALGSSTGTDASRIWDLAREALRLCGQRGIMVGRGLDSNSMPCNVLGVDYVPYQWLFPRVGCVVHHGGAGTTAQALRAGVPSVVVPFTSDQPFWGKRVHALGTGPQPIPARKLSLQALIDAIDTVLDNHQMRSRARELGERIQAEDGVSAAVELVVRYADDAA
jgi:UDP:flavonoid glycosyltransferase YjiC (YdhE family)